jgi:uncharacterized membrane protein
MEPYSNLGTPDIREDERPETGEDESALFSGEEIEDGMDGARFSYLFNFFGLPFCLIPLLKRDNGFSLFHARQAFLLWALFFASLTAGWILSWITLQAMWLFILGGGCSLGLNVLGYQRAMDEKHVPLPLVGGLAESWLAGITVTDPDAGETGAGPD